MPSTLDRFKDLKEKRETWNRLKNVISAEAETAYYKYMKAAVGMEGLLSEFVESAAADQRDCERCPTLKGLEMCRGHA